MAGWRQRVMRQWHTAAYVSIRDICWQDASQHARSGGGREASVRQRVICFRLPVRICCVVCALVRHDVYLVAQA